MSTRFIPSTLVRPSLTMLSFVLAFALLGAAPALAQQQPGHDSHWGVGFSATPAWTLHDSIRKILFDGDGTIKGSEVTIGLVRGSRLGGDFGVSFVRKPFKDGSGENSSDQRCFGQNNTAPCVTVTKRTQTQGVYLNGVEGHWFWAIATIKERAQIGLNIGGGVASVKGTIVKTTDGYDFAGFNPQTGVTNLTPVHTVETLLAKDELISIFPLFKLEAEGSVIVARGLKLKVAGGLNFPSVSMRVGVVYLIGAK